MNFKAFVFNVTFLFYAADFLLILDLSHEVHPVDVKKLARKECG
jgi:hypothetical protein